MNILVTGGAGFVGKHLVSKLVHFGHNVTVLDNLDPQVHQQVPIVPKGVKFIHGDVADKISVMTALEGVDTVYHLAAVVGVGQSMYEPAYYTYNNNYGTTVLLECLVKSQVTKLIVASSMSIYGEGEGVLESQPLSPENVYALSKYDQEQLCLLMGNAYGIKTTALRFFNIYGPGQSLNNPYTGVLAIFASQLLNGKQPQVFEDGEQTRDFISVYDIVQGLILALGGPAGVYNLGTGVPHSVIDVATALAICLKVDIKPNITYKKRKGDIRHCYANIDKAKKQLGFMPRVPLLQGINDLVDWLQTQKCTDKTAAATNELEQRGLLCSTKTA